MSKTLLLSFIALWSLTAAAFGQSASGKSFVQSASEERLFQVTVYSAKPELWSDALRFIKDEVVPANLKGGRKHMEVWTSVFGQSYETWFILPLENFAALDKGDDILLKGLGSNEAVAAFWKKARSLNNNVRQFVIRVPDDVGLARGVRHGQGRGARSGSRSCRARVMSSGRGDSNRSRSPVTG